VMEEAKTH